MTPTDQGGSVRPLAPSLCPASSKEDIQVIQNQLLKSARAFGNVWRYKGLTTDVSGVLEAELSKFKRELEESPAQIADLHASRFQPTEPGSPVSFAEIYNDGFLVVALMKLPEKYEYGFHDHPSMIVLSKVLEGEIAFEFMEIENQSEFYSSHPKIGDTAWARLCDRTLVRGGGCTGLLPRARNIHGMTAKKTTVLLEVLFNYYDDERPCSSFDISGQGEEGRYQLRLVKQE
jgi:hypothetical protein